MSRRANKRLLRRLFQLMHQQLTEIQLDNAFLKTIRSYRSQSYRRKSDSYFYQKLVWIVFNSGFRDLIVERKWKGILEAFGDFSRVAQYGEDDVQRLLQDSSIIRHEGKVRACIENAEATKNIVRQHGSFVSYLTSFKTSEDLKLDLMKRFARIGETNAYAFMKFIGYEHVVKPDVHVRRVLHRVGLISSQKAKADEIATICKKMADAVGENLSVIDEVIWRFGSGYECGMAICGVKPKCNACLLIHCCEFGKARSHQLE